MVKDRHGQHTLGLQIPEMLWRRIEVDAAKAGMSATRVLTLILAKHYQIPMERLPKPKKAGRKPKK